MKSIILAAGRGSRINILTSKQPKCLIKVAGKTLLSWQIKALNNQSSKICIVTGYLSNLIEKDIKNIQKISTVKNILWKKTNMIFSLFCAKKWIDNDDLIISYSDIFYSEEMITELNSSKDDITIIYDKEWFKLWNKRFNDPFEDAETLKVDSRGNLLEIGRKSNDINSFDGQFIGLIKIKKVGWEKINAIKKKINLNEFYKIDTTSFLSFLIDNGLKIKALSSVNRWGEIDTYDDLNLYETLIKENYFKWIK